MGVDTLDGWRRHISGRNASVLAFFGFLSIFPLLLAATTILGLALDGNEDLQRRIIDGALADIPVLGEQLQNDPTSLDGSVWVLVLGLGVALWSATKAFVALQVGLDDVWEIDVDHRDAIHKQRGKALLGLVFIGGAQIAGLAVTTVVSEAGLPLGGRLVLFGATVAINVVVVAAMYRYLTAARLSWADVWPGSIAAGIACDVDPAVRHHDRGADHLERERHLRPVRRGTRTGDVAEPVGHRHDHERRIQRCAHAPPGGFARPSATCERRVLTPWIPGSGLQDRVPVEHREQRRLGRRRQPMAEVA